MWAQTRQVDRAIPDINNHHVAVGAVRSWPAHRRSVTLHQILVHMLAETSRHAGHADIVRELIDGATGLIADRPAMPTTDKAGFAEHRDRVQRAARETQRGVEPTP
jgi:hypothetical protein